jgi:hypothetical protein
MLMAPAFVWPEVLWLRPGGGGPGGTGQVAGGAAATAGLQGDDSTIFVGRGGFAQSPNAVARVTGAQGGNTGSASASSAGTLSTFATKPLLQNASGSGANGQGGVQNSVVSNPAVLNWVTQGGQGAGFSAGWLDGAGASLQAIPSNAWSDYDPDTAIVGGAPGGGNGDNGYADWRRFKFFGGAGGGNNMAGKGGDGGNGGPGSGGGGGGAGLNTGGNGGRGGDGLIIPFWW